MDTCEGPEEKITLHWGKYIRVQILDYEGVSFRCQQCHKVGHIFKDFPLVRKSEDTPKTTPTPSRTDSLAVLCSLALRLTPSTSSPLHKAVDAVNRSISPLLTRARAASEAAKASDTPLTSSTSNLDVFSSVVSSFVYTSMAHCTMSSPPLIATTAPSLHSLSTSSSSPSSSRVSPSHHYYLHSRTLANGIAARQVGLGLTLSDSVPLTSRGRKSNLSKAIKRVGAEVISDRQSTLDGVRRALNTTSRGPP